MARMVSIFFFFFFASFSFLGPSVECRLEALSFAAECNVNMGGWAGERTNDGARKKNARKDGNGSFLGRQDVPGHHANTVPSVGRSVGRAWPASWRLSHQPRWIMMCDPKVPSM
jgi:hypothetical protein